MDADEDSSNGIEIPFKQREEKELDIFEKLMLFERDFKFCCNEDIATHAQRKDKVIICISKCTKNTMHSGHGAAITLTNPNNVLHILKYESNGEEFFISQMSKELVEAIWTNLNFELLYLTSDDDERLSIQVRIA